ncbi:antigen-presenting glycoprotein CD1d1-like [Carettochelys insculpta]|uniref:antigen-presenting glycoprotein CD1d1-like n=1 Tax=Carettochelys insculpta TaxID=44489 RepID=UPI003EB81DA6
MGTEAEDTRAQGCSLQVRTFRKLPGSRRLVSSHWLCCAQAHQGDELPLRAMGGCAHTLCSPFVFSVVLPRPRLHAASAAPAGTVTFQLLKTIVFYNASWTDLEGIARLGDLETHALHYETDSVCFRQPWAHRGLTPKQWQDLETAIRHYLSKFVIFMRRLVEEEGERYPFVTQFSIGCELRPDGTGRGFCDSALDGENFFHLNVEPGAWVTQRGDGLALQIQHYLNNETSTTSVVRFLLKTTCMDEIKSLLHYGKESLERQERPVAVVFAPAPPPAGPPAPTLLVCRVSGFYPRPIRVAWLQDGEEVGPGRRLDSSGILPKADQTYQLCSSLAVGPGAGHRYSCRVEHSSLGGRGLLIPWGHSRLWVPGLAMGTILAALGAVSMVLWRRRWSTKHRELRAGPASPPCGDTAMTTFLAVGEPGS